MSHYIPLQSAAEQLGVTDACLVRQGSKYSPFFKKSDPKRHNAMFDLKGFMRSEELKQELTEKTKLMSEYLHHEENITYVEMAKMAEVTVQQIATCTYGYGTALKLSRAIRNNKPYLFKRFHDYYGWKV